MKVVITEVVTTHDSIMALGLEAYLKGIGIACDVATVQAAPPLTPKTEDRRPLAEIPAKKAAIKKAKAGKAAPVFKSEPDDAPRVTIRSRILNELKSGPKTVRQVLDALNAKGLNSTHELIGQHLYLIGRDKLAVRNEDTNLWSLAA